MDGKLITTAFDDEENKDQIITYLKYDRKFDHYSVRRDIIKYKITPKTCLLYLAIHFPDKNFTKDQVMRLNTIFNLLLKKANFYEFRVNNNAVIGHEKDNEAPGLCCNFGKNDISEHIYFGKNLRILNYDINDYNPESKVSFGVISLLEDNNKYQLFLDFWTSIVDYQLFRNIFKNIFPDEIIDLITNIYLNSVMKT